MTRHAMLNHLFSNIGTLLFRSPRPQHTHAHSLHTRCANEMEPIHVADTQFTYVVTSDALSTHEWLDVRVRAGAVDITLNTNHPAAKMLLSATETPSLAIHSAILCAAIVALEVEAPNQRRRQLHHDARVDIGRILGRMYHHLQENK